MADKTAAMQRLERHGLSTPRSLLVTRSNENLLNAFVESNGDIDYWYLRFEEMLAPRLPRVVSSTELTEQLSAALRTNETLTVIVQQRITAQNSGVMAVRPDAVFVEHVKRELQTLLRAGVTPSRTLLSRTGEVLREELNQQEFYCFWKGDLFKRVSAALGAARLSSHTRDQLVSAAGRFDQCAVFEWIETEAGMVVFLDHRPMPSGFLIGLRELIRGFDSHSYLTLAGGSGNYAQMNNAGESSAFFRLDRPLYEYAQTVLPRAKALAISGGGVLAHLCVYASEREIPCTVSRPRA